MIHSGFSKWHRSRPRGSWASGGPAERRRRRIERDREEERRRDTVCSSRETETDDRSLSCSQDSEAETHPQKRYLIFVFYSKNINTTQVEVKDSTIFLYKSPRFLSTNLLKSVSSFAQINHPPDRCVKITQQDHYTKNREINLLCAFKRNVTCKKREQKQERLSFCIQ